MQSFNIHPQLLELQSLGFNFRHELHKIPESSGKEFKTATFCKNILEQYGFKITTYADITGFIADMRATDSNNKYTIAIRTDMDALEMPDLTQDEYKSIHDGLAHNCGHDMHMAITLLTAVFVAKNASNLPCNVRFIFQMAEESMLVPGADKMVEYGCMDDVDEVYALHNNAALEYGSVEIKNGIMSSFGTFWQLDIKGRAAHSSTPHLGLDAVREGARIISDMDYIVAKNTSPFSPAVFSCGNFHGGNVPNAIADNARLQGMLRAMDKETDKILKNAFTSIESQSKMRGFDTHFTYNSYPAIFNHSFCVERLIDAAKKVLKLPSMLNTSCIPMTASEDFSHMINATSKQKGAMYFLGSGNTQSGICNYLHSNPYYVEDKAILVGSQIWLHIIFDTKMP